jgi:hypothetical protein
LGKNLEHKPLILTYLGEDKSITEWKKKAKTMVQVKLDLKPLI